MCDVINFVFSRAYLAHPWSIFSQIPVCYSWENSLSEGWQPFSNWMTSSWSKSWIKGDIAKFTWFTCYVYGTRIFLESGSYIATFLELYLGHLCSIFFQILICYSWDYKLSQMCLHVSIRRRDHGANFDWKLDFRSSQGRFLAHVLSLWGNFWCSGRVICLPT